ncbi:MAG: FAD-dependent monooxygenase [Bacteroidetes Order II. Incertae sedis bacterium]|nr:FAD-dependent monooxygenase [Bacteroidetes Order II. bacterium]MBT4053469.1 FAD-dependent monooxygenase [Bacteroidetes Order II. bacterium]MBT5248814.1 FAD-dependent monooxygenase [Bacteroidetes Order II. bacterium]MBT6199150.1 FAD-dependent monooxygenase [Bacteroidetes Order II. bacterium]MBT6582215.1 FAD-dependent monooxygenase [Bacteroidetes Order II. bacterium]
MSDNKTHAVIAGGGLAGSLLALTLAERGMRVSVVEKRGDLRSEEAPSGRSINLALSERGIHALKGVGLADTVLENTIPMRGRIIHAVNGETKFLPYSRHSHEFIRAISRPGLNRVLLQRAGDNDQIELHFDTAVSSIDLVQKTISITGSDGQANSLSYDLLFGADGAGSVVRSEIEQSVDLGYQQSMLAHGYKELTIGPEADGGFKLEKEALHIWPRGTYMLIALPNMDGSFTCTLFLPQNSTPGFEQLTTPQAVDAFFSDQFADAKELIPDLTEQFFANPTGVLGTIRCEKWTADGATLILGDAAHAIVPFFGQGMNCAFEDVSVLADFMDSSNYADFSDLLVDYEASRIPNANAIADMALDNYIEMRDLVADPVFRLERSVALELERRHPDHFIPKYSLVSFNRISYQRAHEIGHAQQHMLKTLCQDCTSLDEIDWDRAASMVLTLPELS